MSDLLLFAWMVTGFVSFGFWWTKEHDFTFGEVPTAIIVSALGPAAFFMGWLIHGDPIFTGSGVIFRKRK